MTANLSEEFDAIVALLSYAARKNHPDLCAVFYGHAIKGNMGVNAKVLRIAAENGSYEAFERMLAISAEGNIGIASPYGISNGPDWDKVKEIAQRDDRISAALKQYNAKIESNLEELFPSIEKLLPGLKL